MRDMTMRVKELKWKELPVWPPYWTVRDGKLGEGAVLLNVRLRNDTVLKFICIEAGDAGHKLRGITMLGNPRHLESLYHTLNQHIGKPLTEIGDLEIRS
jgi:hypothetical protein